MTPAPSPAVVTCTSPEQHVWELRDEEFEEGHVIRRFECTGCGGVRFC